MNEAHSVFRDSRWIWPNRHHWDIANGYALFRKSFQLKRIPRSAPLFITADQSYRLFINGVLVGRGPARGVQRKWPYDEVDIRPFLRTGKNLIAIRAYNPGRSTYQYISEGFAGVLVAASWPGIEIRSNSNWRSIRQISAKRDTVQASMQLFNQEHVDLRMEIGNWANLDFDDRDWESPSDDRPWNGGPWFSLAPRGIPLLSEKEIDAGIVIGENQGACALSYREVRDVVALRSLEDRSHLPKILPGDVIAVRAAQPATFRSYLIDFGKTVVGHFIVEVCSASGGEIIDTHYTETIDERTLTPDLVFQNHCRNSIGDRLICRTGNAEHAFYHIYGFRYVTLTVRDITADFTIKLKFRWIGYPLEGQGAFSCSDDALNRIWQTAAWTQQCCSLDAYVDTPWREQAQWWGDARVQAWNTFHLSGDTRLLRRGIEQIADQMTPDGVTYGHAPTMAHECILPDFTLIWMLSIWDYYWQTGSTEPFISHRTQLERALEYFRGRVNPKSGLITYDDRFWLFLDWANMFREGQPTVYNLWLLIALEKIAFLYRKISEPLKAAELEKWASNLRGHLAEFISPRGLIQDGLDSRGEMVTDTSLHSQTLSIIAELRGINKSAQLETIILPYVRGDLVLKADPSAYWITYCLSLLSQSGYGDEVVNFIRKRWSPMINHGTTWENFAPRRGEESFSHAWSAHPLFHLMQTIGGVTQTAPAWKRIRFRPTFQGQYSKTVLPTPHGLISSEWAVNGKFIEIVLKLPKGVAASVELPGREKETASGIGRWKVESFR